MGPPMKKTTKRLQLSRDTVRELNTGELARAGGGIFESAVCGISRLCKTVYWTNCADCVCYPSDDYCGPVGNA